MTATAVAPVETGTGEPHAQGLRTRHLVLVVGLAAAVRFAVALAGINQPNGRYVDDGDGLQYLALARDFKDYIWERTDIFALRRTPAYPAFEAAALAVWDNLRSIMLFQVCVGAATVALIARWGASELTPRVGLLAGLILAVEPLSVGYSTQLTTETLFAFLLVAAAISVHRAVTRASWRACAVSGLLLGLAVLTRPVAQFLPVLWVAGILVLTAVPWRRRGVLALCFLGAFVLPVGAWVCRNVLVTDTVLFSIIDGENLAYYRAPGALAEEEGISFDEGRNRVGLILLDRIDEDDDIAEQSQTLRSVGLEVVRDHPRGAVISAAKGAIRTTVAAGAGWDKVFGWDRSKITLGVTLLVLFPIYALASWGVVQALRRRWIVGLCVALGTIAYLTLAVAGPEATGRFRVPMMPFWALLAGLGLASLSSGRRRQA